MMARNRNVPFKGRIQKRKTYRFQIVTFGLQRAAGPYRRARCGPTLDATHRHYAAPNGTPSSVTQCIRRRFALVIV